MSEISLEDIASLCKRRGFIFQGSEIYGGLAGTWDYGPLGVALKRNLMQLWWKMFVEERDDMFGIDAAILMNQKVWQASGHTATFTDPMTVCTNCNSRFRVDKIVNEKQYKDEVEATLTEFWKSQWSNYKDQSSLVTELKEENEPLSKEVAAGLEELDKLKQADISTDIYKEWADSLSQKIEKNKANTKELSKKYDYLLAFLRFLEVIDNEINNAKQYLGKSAQSFLKFNVKCPVCGSRDSWTEPKRFNMMFKTHVGPIDDDSSTSYLRPETAQGIFTNYKNVVDSLYPDLPFGLAQQGKAFRNEISPRDFVFRSREFEQMEIEYFVNPEKWEEAFEMWRERVHNWFKAIGLPDDKIHELEVPADDLAHYSKRTIDFEFDYPHGKDEILGLAYRTDFDLGNIQRASGKSMEYRPKDGSAPFVPHVIEPSFGVERALMAVLVAAYTVDEVNGEKRTVLKLPKNLAPVKAAVSPLLKNKPELVGKAREVYQMLHKELGAVMWDDNGNIGKRYRRQDEIGTPACITIDFQTLEDGTVTVRDRDTATQTRVAIDQLLKLL